VTPVRSYHWPPVLPVVALVLMPFLPFVNTTGLWFGLPRMMVWGALWCAMLVPALLLSERLMARRSAETGAEEDG
jgi:hypothetical protein